jgi:hypothetical protein
MKIKLIGLFIGLVLLSVTISAYSFWDAAQPVAKISFPLGNVKILHKGKKKMQKARFQDKLYGGDKIKTEKGARCEIKYNDGSVIRIDQRSIYTIESAKITKKEKKVESSLSIGRLWANIKKLASSSDNWFLRGPSAVVAVRGTVYRMDSMEDKSAKVLVYSGSVNVGSPSWAPNAGSKAQGRNPGAPQQVQGPSYVKGPSVVSLEEWVEIVKAQQQIIVKPDGSFQKSDFNLVADAQSDWVKWNLERDKLIK